MTPAPSQRYLGPDVIRGVAVFLMFLTNAPGIIGLMLYDGDARFQPQTLSAPDMVGWGIALTLPAVGGIGIFAAMMGFGLAGAMRFGPRRSLREQPQVWARFAVLGVIGFLHAVLFWWGDILSTYAIVGLLALLFAGLHPSITRSWAIALFAIPFIFAVISAFALIGPLPDDVRSLLQRTSLPDGLDRVAATEIYRHGSGREIVEYRVRETLYFGGQFLPLAVPQIIGALLIGIVVRRKGWLEPGAVDARRTLRAAIVIGAPGVALCLAYTVALVLISDPLSPVLAFGDAARLAGAPLFGAGVAMAALAWANSRRAPQLQRRTADVGRMTLSMYLLQSVSLSVLCYLLPLYAAIGRLGQVLVGVGYGVLALMIAPFWLRHRRRGPVEALVERGGALLAPMLPGPSAEVAGSSVPQPRHATHPGPVGPTRSEP